MVLIEVWSSRQAFCPLQRVQLGLTPGQLRLDGDDVADALRPGEQDLDPLEALLLGPDPHLGVDDLGGHVLGAGRGRHERRRPPSGRPRCRRTRRPGPGSPAGTADTSPSSSVSVSSSVTSPRCGRRPPAARRTGLRATSSLRSDTTPVRDHRPLLDRVRGRRAAGRRLLAGHLARDATSAPPPSCLAALGRRRSSATPRPRPPAPCAAPASEEPAAGGRRAGGRARAGRAAAIGTSESEGPVRPTRRRGGGRRFMAVRRPGPPIRFHRPAGLAAVGP